MGQIKGTGQALAVVAMWSHGLIVEGCKLAFRQRGLCVVKVNDGGDAEGEGDLSGYEEHAVVGGEDVERRLKSFIVKGLEPRRKRGFVLRLGSLHLHLDFLF